MKNYSSFERAMMSGATRFWISLIGISFTFALGRVFAQALGRLLAVPEEKMVEIANRPTESVTISADPSDVYKVARQLEYFDRFLFGVDKFNLINPSTARLVVGEGGNEYGLHLEVIADQPGEFFALRIELNGRLYGTCAVRFDGLPGNTGTTVSVLTKYKMRLPDGAMNAVRPVVSREVDVYLRNLKRLCELTVAEPALG